MAKTKPAPSPKPITTSGTNNVTEKGIRGTFGRTITTPSSGKRSPKK